MAFSLPDKGEGANDVQSILFQEHLDMIVAGIAGSECVLAGCDVTAQGSPDMTVAVAKGSVIAGGVLKPVTAGNVTISAADGSNPRLDLVVVNSAGTKAVRTGTAAANPKPPARTAGDVVLAQIYVPASDTTIASNQITDMRLVRSQGPIVLDKSASAVSFNTTAAEQTYYSLTVPNGLLATVGRMIRVKLGGTMLLNSGTATVRLVVTFGGTTLFSDISGASTNDADRLAWHLELILVATGSATQILVGSLGIASIAAKTAPTTGIGDAWATAGLGGNPIRGSSSVDANSADRVFDVRFTMSVANASCEIVREYVTAELL